MKRYRLRLKSLGNISGKIYVIKRSSLRYKKLKLSKYSYYKISRSYVFNRLSCLFFLNISNVILNIFRGARSVVSSKRRLY